MFTRERPRLGTSIDDLETPVLLVELDVFEANMAAMLEFCRAHGTGWRPHSKCHKCPDIARLQLRRGACGITCAKLSEAEMFAAHGIGPLLIANQVVTPAKLARLARLQRQQEVLVAVDDATVVPLTAQAATAAGVTIPVLIEVDIGMNRVGAVPGKEVLDIAVLVARSHGLELRGIMGYEGHVLSIPDAAEKTRACHQALDILLDSRDLLARHGLPVSVVSAGGTGSYQITAAYPGITEVQAGGGVFMDAMYRHKCHVEGLDYALTCLTTVTSRTATHVVVDAGFKAMSSYHHEPLPHGRRDLELRGLSAEHGIFTLQPGACGPQIGEKVRFVVGYGDSTAVLHDYFVGVRGGRVERIWDIAGRGLLE